MPEQHRSARPRAVVTTALLGALVVAVPAGSAGATSGAGPITAASAASAAPAAPAGAQDPAAQLTGELVLVAEPHPGPGGRFAHEGDHVAAAFLRVPAAGSGTGSSSTGGPTLVPLDVASLPDAATAPSGSRVAVTVEVPDPVVAAAAADRPVATLTGSALVDDGELAAARRGAGAPPGSDLASASAATAAATGEGLDVRSATVTAPAEAPALAAAATTNRVHVAVVGVHGLSAAGHTNAEVDAALTGAGTFWREQTGSRVSFARSGSIARYTSGRSCSDPSGIWQEAAARTGFTGAAGEHLLVVLPYAAMDRGCGYGLGSVGAGPGDGGVTYVVDTNWTVVAHELGHNLSLWHANRLDCGRHDAPQGSSGSFGDCAVREYGDEADVMAVSGPAVGNLGAVGLRRLRLLPSGAAATVTAAGETTVVLTPLSARTGLRAVAVRDPRTGTTYHLEARANAGRDAAAWRDDPATTFGLRVLKADGHGASVLLDPTPSAPRTWDPDAALRPGATFASTSDGVRVTTTGVAADGRVTARVSLAAAGTAHRADALVPGPIADRWATSKDLLGHPVTPQRATPDGRGRYVHFARGSVYWTSATGAQALGRGAVAAWSGTGWERGPLGYPTTTEAATPDGRGRYAHFQGGSVYWTADTGAHALPAVVRDPWAAQGWHAGPLGFPTTGVRTTPDGRGRYAHFQGGSVYWTAATGGQSLTAPLRDAWARTGWEGGVLGYPTTSTRALAGGGSYAHFQGGSVYASPATGAHPVHGAIGAAWAARGWERGLGYPLAAEHAVAGGRRQDFQRGTITWRASDGSTSVTTR